jgi:alcohol dehydrogenase
MTMIAEFTFASTPRIHFGIGRRAVIPDILTPFGRRILLITGSTSLESSPPGQGILQSLEPFDLFRFSVAGEPSPSLVDDAVRAFHPEQIDAVLAIGGGSVIDAGKAIAGLLSIGHSVMEYLEGVGRGLAYHGPSIPFVAVPTTAGTGGETSKNAVLSVQGEAGFKKSFRHEQLIAKAIVVDPELTLSCPPELTAACGMDALTQLIESYVSSKANPMTDALAESGIKKVRDCLMRAYENGKTDIEARAGMSYAAFVSGLTLANAGLGSVHGLASPLGAFFPIPHGVVCGTLVAEATHINMEAMLTREPDNPALGRYADIGRWLSGDPGLSDRVARERLLEILRGWTETMKLPHLSVYGVRGKDVDRIVANSRGSSMQTNPVLLSDEEIAAIVVARL